jgi:zinc/manganese transport system permease protein
LAAPDNHFWLIPLLLAGVCGLTCPLLGTLLVLQRRIQATNLMAYAVLPGVVIAQAFGLSHLLGGVASALGAVLLAEAVIATRSDGRDAAEAVLNTVLAGSLGLGVLLVQALALPVDLEALLFGDLLVAGPEDLLRMVLVLGLLIVMIRWPFQQWQWLGLDPEGAESLELPMGRLRLLMAALTALVVVSATAAVGLALVMALICAPSLASLAGATSLEQALRRAALIGLVVSLAGCAIGLRLNLPPGPLMACACLPLVLWLGPPPRRIGSTSRPPRSG